MAIHSSILVWRIPWAEEPGRPGATNTFPFRPLPSCLAWSRSLSLDRVGMATLVSRQRRGCNLACPESEGPASGKPAIDAAGVLMMACWAVETTLGPHVPLGRESPQPHCTSEETEAQELKVS